MLGTRDLEWYRLEDSDFHNEETSREIKICCTFEDLTAADQSAFVEYLSYSQTSPHSPFLVLTVTAKDSGETRKGRPYRRVEMRSGVKGDGPPFSAEIRELFRATYLRPLRDAAQALSSGRGSRLSQVLHQTDQVKSTGTAYEPDGSNDINSLNILGIGDLANDLLPAVKSRRWRVKSDFAGEAGLQERKDDIVAKASGQSVKTFVADQWTLEYDLAVGPKEGTDFRGTLAEHVWVAACLAESDEAIHAQKTNAEAVTKTAVDDFAVLKKEVVASSTGTAKEQLASHIYAKFESGKASKTVAAQYLAARLNTAVKQGQFTTTQMREALPPYLVAAIDYVTRAPAAGSEP